VEPRLWVRRARKGDFERVRALLGDDAPAERADRKRFRRLVSTLREDLYLVEAERESALAGLAVIAYTRGLGPPTAVLRLIAASPPAAALLLESARARAAARGCVRLEVQLERARADALASELLARGWSEGPVSLVRAVTP